LYFTAFTLPTGSELFVLSDSAALNIQQASWTADIKVYPNPTNANATIAVTLKESTSFGYYNRHGR
jgi:hypothetical protein